MSQGRYNIILADPPWWYSNRRMAGKRTRFGGGARSHYPVMRDAELLGLAELVRPLAAENCALCLWVTCARLDFAFRLAESWGFVDRTRRRGRYATVLFTWIKISKRSEPIYGGGNYTGSNAELVLLFVKGSMPAASRLVPSVVLYPRLRPGEKPPVVRERIVRVFGDLPRIELFARHAVPGWDAWGNEVGKLAVTNGRLQW